MTKKKVNIKESIFLFLFLFAQLGPSKLNDTFTFEKEIYLDRFMDCNYELYRNIQDKVLGLKQQYQKIQDDLRKFDYFDDTNMSIQNVLGKFEKFLTMQRNKTFSLDPLYFGVHNQQEANITTNLIFTYKNFIDKRVNELKNSLKKINEEIEKYYNTFKKNFKYCLLGILMHEGHAGNQLFSLQNSIKIYRFWSLFCLYL